MGNNKRTVAIDFDGVIHKYSKKWHDGTVYDEPVEGAKEAIDVFVKQGYRIVIFTARPIEPISRWMLTYGIHFDEITNTKPIAVLYIDDNAYRFTNWEKALFQIQYRGLLKEEGVI